MTAQCDPGDGGRGRSLTPHGARVVRDNNGSPLGKSTIEPCLLRMKDHEVSMEVSLIVAVEG
jgi:hypothetical protein